MLQKTVRLTECHGASARRLSRVAEIFLLARLEQRPRKPVPQGASGTPVQQEAAQRREQA